MRSLPRFAALAIALSLTACVAEPPGGPDDLGDGGDDGKADSVGTPNGMTVVLRGTVVTMDEQRGTKDVLDNAAVVVKGDKIVDILPSGTPLPSGSDVLVLPSATGTSDWIITPGLINAHNHLAYNTAQIYPDLPLYQNTYQWRDEDYYDQHIQLPKRLLGSCTADVDELGVAPYKGNRRVKYSALIGRWSEAKELVSGTTSTQGSYFGSVIPSGYGQSLVRNLDGNNFGTKKVSQESLGILVGTFDPREVVARMNKGSVVAWLVHLAEGTDQESSDEFECVRAMGLLRKELVIIHGTGLTAAQLHDMGQVGAKLVASPLDNLMYYGRVPDLPTAKKAGVIVSLGTDWTPAGSKNLLVELKVADLINQQVWKNYFTNRDLLAMVTRNPADTIGWSDKVGRLRKGMIADIAVYRRRGSSAFRSVIDSTEADVRLVMVGGDPLFGDVAFMKALKPNDHEVVQSGCGFTKAIDLTSGSTKVEHGDITLAMVEGALDEALDFDFDWILAHLDDAIEGDWTAAQLTAYLKNKYPFVMKPRELNPLFSCEDTAMLDEIRTDPNIRTAHTGICLDLRKWYSGASSSNCGAMPAKPHLVTVQEQPGALPQRPAAWCAEQDWTSPGTLPKP